MACPTKDSELATFSPNFSAIVSASPLTYNTTAPAAALLATASAGFVLAYNACRADGMKSKSLTTTKDAAKAALFLLLRPMYGAISALTTVSDTLNVNLGIAVRRMPSPQPAPSLAPAVTVVSVTGRSVKLRLRDAASPHRIGKPVAVSSATIMSFVGTTPPASMGLWKFEANVSRTVLDVTFPDTVAAGAQVWFTVFWSNRRDQSGPACDPVGSFLQYGSVSMAA